MELMVLARESGRVLVTILPLPLTPTLTLTLAPARNLTPALISTPPLPLLYPNPTPTLPQPYP